MRFLLPLLLSFAVAGCASASAPVAPPGLAASPAPAKASVTPSPVMAPVARDWRDWPLTPGDWVYRRDARGSIALFGRSGADAELTIRCDRIAGQIYLSRRGRGAPATLPEAAMVATVRTSSTLRSLTMQPTGGTLGYLAIALNPRDTLLDAMGFSRGRFVLEQTGYQTLVVPAWAEILRVTEDCR